MAWNQSTGAAAKPQPKKPSAMRGVIAGVAVVAAAVAIFFAMSGKDEKPKAKVSSKVTTIKEVKPVVKRPTAEAPKMDTPAHQNEYAARFPNMKINKVTTNLTGYIEVDMVDSNGVRTVHYVAPPQIFECETDQLILNLLGARPGQAVPPLPNLGGRRADKAFLESLKTPIVDKPGDSDKVRAQKEIVRAAREEIKAAMDRGAHFADIMEEQATLKEENGTIRRKAMQELNELAKKGDWEGAQKYMDGINDAFSKMDIQPIYILKKYKKMEDQQ